MPDDRKNGDVATLAKEARELGKLVADDLHELRDAERQKADADAALLLRVLAEVKDALPAITNYRDRAAKMRSVELVEGKPDSTIYEDGSLETDAVVLCGRYSIRRILERLIDLLDRQRRDVAARKHLEHAKRVRAILTLLG